MVRDAVSRPAGRDGDTESGGPGARDRSPAAEVTSHPFWLQTNDPKRSLSVPPWVLDVVQEANEILVLAQLNYWFRLAENQRLRAQAAFDGHAWVAKTHAELGREVRRTARQIKKAVKGLRARGFLVVARRCSRYHGLRAVTHFRLNWDALAAAHEAAAQKGRDDDAGSDLW
jgi:hypothetical protein